MNPMQLHSPWAILPSRLVEMQASQPNGAGQHEPPVYGSYINHDGTAVISITGIIGKGWSPAMRVFGGTSTGMIAKQIQTALADHSVKQILLYIDSAGGAVDGTQALAEMVLAARGKKPITALGDGMMASAAYWIGSSADKVYAASGTTQVGSIGVVAAHLDISGLESQMGVKTTEISAGRFKRITSQYEPLSADGRANIQESVDYLYGLFVSHVAKARRVPEKTVLSSMAEGRVFIGKQAQTAGLIDGIKTLEEILKGTSMNLEQSSIARASSHNEREALHAKAKAHQAAHPGTDLVTAMQAVSDPKHCAVGRTIVEDDRFELHKRAKAYQAKHPGTTYLNAVQAISAHG